MIIDSDLYFKNGRAKKKYCKCLSREQIAMLKSIHGQEIIQCAGNSCVYYSIGCGRMNIESYKKQ